MIHQQNGQKLAEDGLATPRDGLVAEIKGVAEKIESLLRHSADPGLFRVYPKPDPRHDLFH
ncbi:hypothetical protein [Candidatus Methylacidiphilum fumarolicum]|uniref:Uncharacterized protein n=1 Tax=Candidatus Methylacidiphilum fumarolicum TaxID=591154 RepID=A0ABN8XEU4_9BACT|nr:hypothetical protein [Candidatus Methylacidiphilum fumarolicum]CAI9084856.1 protein of unknown function [Candidatus Methylacidiphilum fumarolicum]